MMLIGRTTQVIPARMIVPFHHHPSKPNTETIPMHDITALSQRIARPPWLGVSALLMDIPTDA